ncbi:hypothetical protein SAMN04487934_103206 [Eubacterium ruminantium]|nr:hypothetical protein SAMN04487934_103206 [Eubacterium ruminantium]
MRKKWFILLSALFVFMTANGAEVSAEEVSEDTTVVTIGEETFDEDFDAEIVGDDNKETHDAIAYSITEGKNLKWRKGGYGTLRFTIDRNVDNEHTLDTWFAGVIKVDDIGVSAAEYDVEAGGLILTMYDDFLNNLAVGEHTIKVVFQDAEVVIIFEVLESVRETDDDGVFYEDKDKTEEKTEAEKTTESGSSSAIYDWGDSTQKEDNDEYYSGGATSGDASIESPQTSDKTNLKMAYISMFFSMFMMVFLRGLENRKKTLKYRKRMDDIY